MSSGGTGLVVVGSANRDHITSVPAVPVAGQTVLGSDPIVRLGGKGMNQAVAASLLGARVDFVGAVGADDAGSRITEGLREHGIGIDGLRVADGVPSGAAYVTVGPDGDNSIVVAPGANLTVDADRARSALADSPAAVVVCQLEIPVNTVEAVAASCAESGRRFVLNLAPFTVVPGDVLAVADPLVVNVHEARALAREVTADDATDDGATGDAAGAGALAAGLCRWCRSVVVTSGPGGAVVAAGTAVTRHPATAADAVDTTGAGDAFVGALAAALTSGADLPAAADLAVAMSSATVTRRGAQSSYPDAARSARTG
ncbi:ribokinase [Haloactinopolyspora alba]|uniref:Ribokinase n=1 Tax=Haloactinopolyspora alba TaxID=648780 RepID=A0A2P8E8R7_9ACTN|nr:ribokinase [Haloactinopolyspora alba]PSL05854.1 ribokinase [Haloactinopolyspora alba]